MQYPPDTGGGLSARCLRCEATYTLRLPRHDKIANHRCDCGSWLYNGRPGPNRGRFLCPVTGEVVTLGQTGIRLDQAYRLVFRPGRVAIGTPHEQLVSAPYNYMQETLDRLAGTILGPGAVVDRDYDPYLYDHLPEPQRSQRIGPGLALALAPVATGTVIEQFVNSPLTYGRCIACRGRVLDLPINHVSTEHWVPWRRVVVRKRHGATTVTPVDQGPHPADSLACTHCAPRPR
ncbi:hypothetical protein [Nocardia altamirensis]|uniref:hypothetical protein n=1 Tax=Nocardia altamirensis TaxID=472158 RepID=UPI000840117B|nr:hypothetical protein [Nocardia altamirensis]